MKILLTAFGIADALNHKYQYRAPTPFYRMPPVNMHFAKQIFAPDYSTLLLCSQIVMDEHSFEILLSKPHPSYSLVAETIIALEKEGYIQLVNYERIIKSNRSLLDKMLEEDLRAPSVWFETFLESMQIWNEFYSRAIGTLSFTHYGGVSHAPSLIFPDDYPLIEYYYHDSKGILSQFYGNSTTLDYRLSISRNRFKEILESYLSYINTNLVLTNELGIPFHDWNDFTPFYKKKFLSLGKLNVDGENMIEASRKLFQISFPEYAIKDTKALLKILSDKRIQDLRGLIQKAATGEIEFDNEFAKRTYSEVLSVQKKIEKYRRIVSYLTIPLSLIPGVGHPIQKGTEEVIDFAIGKVLKTEYRWHYFLSEVFDKN